MGAIDAEPVRVLLLERHALVRSGLRLLLAGPQRFVVVADAASGLEGLARLEELGGARGVDVVVAGDNLPGLAVPDLAQRIKAHAPGVRVLLLTFGPESSAGADGYLDKRRAASGGLVAAIAALATPLAHADANSAENVCG